MTLRRDAISAASELIQESGAPNGRERVKILEENCARRTSRFQRSCRSSGCKYPRREQILASNRLRAESKSSSNGLRSITIPPPERRCSHSATPELLNSCFLGPRRAHRLAI